MVTTILEQAPAVFLSSSKFPSNAICPLFRRIIRCAISSRSSMSWLVTIIVVPHSRLISFKMYHLLFGQLIQAQCRLIQENYGRIVQKRHRNIRPHALAKAQFPGKCVKEVFQIEQFRYKCQIFFVYCIRIPPYLLFPFEAGNDG